MARAWTLISIAAGRQYGGNLGYEDDPTRVYRYDSSVANHRRVFQGDLVFIRDRRTVLGMARIERINTVPGTKTRFRCPSCRTPQIKERKHSLPRWRCVKGHVFEQPTKDQAAVMLYEAHYAGTFCQSGDAISIANLKDAAPRPNDQLSIEEVNLTLLEERIVTLGSQVRELLGRYLQGRHPDSSNIADRTAKEAPRESFTPNLTDRRERTIRAIAQRRGQRTFRNRLIRRYGSACMVSGCDLLDVVEAAHIWPYRGVDDRAD